MVGQVSGYIGIGNCINMAPWPGTFVVSKWSLQVNRSNRISKTGQYNCQFNEDNFIYFFSSKKKVWPFVKQ